MLRESEVFVYHFDVLILLCCRWEFYCISDNNNIYVGLISTTLSRRLTMHLSDTSSIAQHLKKHSCPTTQLRKILTDMLIFRAVFFFFIPSDFIKTCFFMTWVIDPPILLRTKCNTRSLLKWRVTSSNSDFSFSLTICCTKAKEHRLANDLPLVGGRRNGLTPFSR